MWLIYHVKFLKSVILNCIILRYKKVFLIICNDDKYLNINKYFENI